MPFQEFQDNLKKLSDLIASLPNLDDPQSNALMQQFIQQNLSLLNEIATVTVHNLQKLQDVKNASDIVYNQVNFTHELSKQLTHCTQRFMNASLCNIADYNQWLKAHCEMATD